MKDNDNRLFHLANTDADEGMDFEELERERQWDEMEARMAKEDELELCRQEEADEAEKAAWRGADAIYRHEWERLAAEEEREDRLAARDDAKWREAMDNGWFDTDEEERHEAELDFLVSWEYYDLLAEFTDPLGFRQERRNADWAWYSEVRRNFVEVVNN